MSRSLIKCSFYRKGATTSPTLFLFCLMDAVCKSIVIRTEFKREDQHLTSWILFGGSLMSLFLNCWADYPSDPEYLESDTPCPYASSSFPNRLIFSWITPLIIRGFRNPLTAETLWDLLPSLRSKAITKKFEQNYQPSVMAAKTVPIVTDIPESVEKNQPSTKKSTSKRTSSRARFVSVFPALVKTFGPTFFFGSLLKLVADMFSIFTPQIMKLMINFAETRIDPDDPNVILMNKEETWKGYFYGVLLFAAITIQSLMVNKYFDQMFMLGLKVRTALISVVYKKALNISAAAKKDSTVGEIVNIMSVDIQKFMVRAFR